MKEIKARLLGRAQNEGLICWNSGAIDGSFSLWDEVTYGYKGKGILIHLLVDADGMPLSAYCRPGKRRRTKECRAVAGDGCGKDRKAGVTAKKNCGESRRTKDMIPMR